jgi:hypothetical protein
MRARYLPPPTGKVSITTSKSAQRVMYSLPWNHQESEKEREEVDLHLSKEHNSVRQLLPKEGSEVTNGSWGHRLLGPHGEEKDAVRVLEQHSMHAVDHERRELVESLGDAIEPHGLLRGASTDCLNQLLKIIESWGGGGVALQMSGTQQRGDERELLWDSLKQIGRWGRERSRGIPISCEIQLFESEGWLGLLEEGRKPLLEKESLRVPLLLLQRGQQVTFEEDRRDEVVWTTAMTRREQSWATRLLLTRVVELYGGAKRGVVEDAGGDGVAPEDERLGGKTTEGEEIGRQVHADLTEDK